MGKHKHSNIDNPYIFVQKLWHDVKKQNK